MARLPEKFEIFPRQSPSCSSLTLFYSVHIVTRRSPLSIILQPLGLNWREKTRSDRIFQYGPRTRFINNKRFVYYKSNKEAGQSEILYLHEMLRSYRGSLDHLRDLEDTRQWPCIFFCALKWLSCFLIS